MGTITSVTVTPSSTNVQPGASQQFQAKVSGTGNFATTVNWSVAGSIGGDSAVGIISSSGLYTAPSSLPNPNTVTVAATSTVASQSGSANVVIGSAPFQITGVSITPPSATVPTAQTQQFTASVQGTGIFNPTVSWYVGNMPGGDSFVGTISSTGLYTAPETLPSGPVTIQAHSVVDSSISANAALTIVQGPPTITSLSPAVANASDSLQILGHNFLGAIPSTITVFFPGSNGMQIATLPDLGSSTETRLDVVVPLLSVSGEVFVQAQSSSGAIQTSNSLSFTRLPRVRIRAAQRDVSPGEVVAFQSRIFPVTTTSPLAWSVDVGSVAPDGTYTAPGTITSDAFAVVTACIQGTQICDQQRLGLHPFLIAPQNPLVPQGSTLQMEGKLGPSTIAPTWALNGPGSISSSGLFSPSAQSADAGGIPVTATYSGMSESTSVGVTGAFPGIVSRVSDYFDLNQSPNPVGTWAVDVGTVGTKAYVVSTNKFDYVGNQNYYWGDVYDITDPTNPLWIDAFEPAMRPTATISCSGYLYEIAFADYSQGPPFPGMIAVYDVSGSHPSLVFRGLYNLTGFTQTGCVLTSFSTGTPTVVTQFTLQNGGVTQAQFNLPPSPVTAGGSAVSDREHLYFLLDQNLLVYDLTTQPPSQLASVPVANALGSFLSLANNTLLVTPGLLNEVVTQVYDVSNPQQPVLLPPLSTGRILATNGTTSLTATGDSGLRMLDTSDPKSPVLTASLFDFVTAHETATLVGNYVLATEGYGGLATYDVGRPGGLFANYLNATSGQVSNFSVLGEADNASNVFFAINAPLGNSGVLSFDLTAQPATFLSSFSTRNTPAIAVAVASNTLYLGTSSSLQILDITNPSGMTEIGSTGSGILSLVASANSLFAGTISKQLVVYDITQPTTPQQVASLNLPASPYNIAVSGNLLFVADTSAGLLIYDVTIPSAPVFLSQITPSVGVLDVAIDGKLALLAAWNAGLVVADISSPASPKVLGQAALGTLDPYSSLTTQLQNKAASIALSGKIAFVGVDNQDTSMAPNDGQAMIYGFDYTNPAEPRLVHLGSYSNITADAVLTLRSKGNRVFAGLVESIAEFDITQPRNTINLLFLPSALTPSPVSAPTSSGQKVQKLFLDRTNPRNLPSQSKPTVGR